ncbi:MAG: methyltransferase domain-containing protein [Chitinophagaceae bacterium]|nr:methyltransferase domain-containing protein [Oligoflexus sp.]
MSTDRNFDDLFERFHRNIKGSDKGRLRETLIREDLETAIESLKTPGLKILDAGCGLGDMSVWLAKMGHVVTSTDLSIKMVEHTQTLAQTEGVTLDVRHLPLQEVLDGKERYDLICIHAVMEWLAHPYEILDKLAACLNPGGFVSLTVYNLHRTIFNGLIKGDFYKILNQNFSGESAKSMTPPNPIEPERVDARLKELGFDLVIHAGLRCFYDFITPEVRDKRSYEQILLLEQRYRKLSPYRDIARYVHFVAQIKA